jgi:hypothetical protein
MGGAQSPPIATGRGIAAKSSIRPEAKGMFSGGKEAKTEVPGGTSVFVLFGCPLRFQLSLGQGLAR